MGLVRVFGRSGRCMTLSTISSGKSATTGTKNTIGSRPDCQVIGIKIIDSHGLIHRRNEWRRWQCPGQQQHLPSTESCRNHA